MNVELITREDLRQFKTELLADLTNIISKGSAPAQSKWMKSAQVRALLKISPGTLQTLRINGHLRYTKVGGSFYYQHDDIESMLSKNAVKSIR
jgi:hypothetical protein